MGSAVVVPGHIDPVNRRQSAALCAPSMLLSLREALQEEGA